MAASSCQPKTVFESSTVDIQHCPDCQLIHLSMGSITIRMSQQHFTQYAEDITKGLFELNSESDSHPAMRLMM